MSRAWNKLLGMLLLALTAVMPGACNVYEWYDEEPEPGPPTPPEPETPSFVLNLNFDTDLPLYQEVSYSRAATDPHDVRYQIMIYEGTGDITSSSVPLRTMTFTRQIAESLDYSVELDLDEGSYSFLVWTDYVGSGTTTDKYYTTGNLSSISLSDQNNHPGSNPYRDAFRGQTTGTVVKSLGGWAEVKMQRPMARFEFITTDLDDFVAKVAARQAAEQGRGSDPDLVEALAEESRADISDYTVTFNYTFMPSTYNIYTDKPTDAWAGTQFSSQFESVSEGTRMGYDYVFVNGTESLVNVAVQVKDSSGNVVAATNSIEVPLVRSKLTVVKGEFMSSTSGGGVAIDPGYDGEYNIEIR